LQGSQREEASGGLASRGGEQARKQQKGKENAGTASHNVKDLTRGKFQRTERRKD